MKCDRAGFQAILLLLGAIIGVVYLCVQPGMIDLGRFGAVLILLGGMSVLIFFGAAVKPPKILIMGILILVLGITMRCVGPVYSSNMRQCADFVHQIIPDSSVTTTFKLPVEGGDLSSQIAFGIKQNIKLPVGGADLSSFPPPYFGIEEPNDSTVRYSPLTKGIPERMQAQSFAAAQTVILVVPVQVGTTAGTLGGKWKWAINDYYVRFINVKTRSVSPPYFLANHNSIYSSTGPFTPGTEHYSAVLEKTLELASQLKKAPVMLPLIHPPVQNK